MHDLKLSVVIPAHNEGPRLAGTIDSIASTRLAFPGLAITTASA